QRAPDEDRRQADDDTEVEGLHGAARAHAVGPAAHAHQREHRQHAERRSQHAQHHGRCAQVNGVEQQREARPHERGMVQRAQRGDEINGLHPAGPTPGPGDQRRRTFTATARMEADSSQKAGAMPNAAPSAPDTSGSTVWLKLFSVERRPTASAARPAGAFSYSRALTMGAPMAWPMPSRSANPTRKGTLEDNEKPK